MEVQFILGKAENNKVVSLVEKKSFKESWQNNFDLSSLLCYHIHGL